MRKPEYYAAVYGILENENGEILCLQRQNTGFMDGKYGLPAGHLEGEETMKQGAAREIGEEIGIIVEEDDLELVHINHRVTKGERIYFDFYFKIHNFSGEISNTEPEKCSELKFLFPDNEEIIPYLRDTFQKIKIGERFSEIII